MVMLMFLLTLVFLSNYLVAACMMLMYSFTLFCSNANWIKVHFLSRIKTRSVICGLVTLGLQSDSVSLIETYLLFFQFSAALRESFVWVLHSKYVLVVSVFGRTNYNVSLLCVFFFVRASVLLFHFFILMVLPVSYVSHVDLLRLLVFP